MPKTSQTPFYKNSTVVLCKKRLEKTPNIREMRIFWISAILQRLEPMQRLQPFQNVQFGSNIENAKNMRKTILQEQHSCSVKKNARTNTKYSRNETVLKIGYSPCKGYSLCKSVSLVTSGPKLKFPKTSDKRLYNHTRVVLRKKRLEKTPNI